MPKIDEREPDLNTETENIRRPSEEIAGAPMGGGKIAPAADPENASSGGSPVTPSEPALRPHEGNPAARRIMKNFLSLSGANFLCKGLSFAATAYLARILTAEGYGILGFAQAVLVYFQLLINEGFDTFGAREIARRPEETRRYVDNILTIRTILSFASYGLLAVFALAIPKPPVVKAAILILGAKLFDLTINLKWVFQGREKMEWIAASRVLPLLFYVGTVFMLVHSPQNILRVPMLQVATAFAGSLGLLLLYVMSTGRVRPRFELRFWREIFRQSLPMAATYLLIQVYVNFDMIFLGFMRDEETVGYYNAAYKMINMINLFGIYYFTSLFPNISRLYGESREKLRALLETSMRHVTIFAVPLAVGGTILAAPLIGLTYGSGFMPAALPFSLLVWNISVIWISLHYGNALMGCDRQGKYMRAVAIGAVSNIVLNFIFIPRYGMAAAALTTIFSELAVLALTYAAMRDIVDLRFGRLLVKPAIASVLMGAVILPLVHWHVTARIAAGAAVYFPILYLVRGLGRGDISRLKAFAGGR